MRIFVHWLLLNAQFAALTLFVEPAEIDAAREASPGIEPPAGPGDLILLAGKGHESSIFYGSEKQPWDEARVAREALAAAGWSDA